MGLKQTQKNKRTNEPQTNGKYKIRQIITKTKEHTYINTHTHTHTNKTKTVQIKKVQECNWAKKTTNDIDQLKTKLKHKLENKTKAECQRGNKGRKTKQTNKHDEIKK